MSTFQHARLWAVVLASVVALVAPSTTVLAYNDNNRGHHYGQLKHPKHPPTPQPPPQPTPGPVTTTTKPPSSKAHGGVTPAAIVAAAAPASVSTSPSTGTIQVPTGVGLVAAPAQNDPRILVIYGILAALMGLWLLLVAVAVVRAYRRRTSPEVAAT